jgi:hypothetical protein
MAKITRHYRLDFDVTGNKVTKAQLDYYLTYWIHEDGDGIKNLRVKVTEVPQKKKLANG